MRNNEELHINPIIDLSQIGLNWEILKSRSLGLLDFTRLQQIRVIKEHTLFQNQNFINNNRCLFPDENILDE